MENDVIVIGSGIGGLSCAGLLSLFNKKVLLLEGGNMGGCMQSVYLPNETEEFSWRWNLGLQWICKYGKKDIEGILLELFTNNKVTMNQLDDKFQYIELPDLDNFKFIAYADTQKMIASLLSAFPGEKEKIGKYYGYLQKIFGKYLGLGIAKLFKTENAEFLYPKIIKHLYPELSEELYPLLDISVKKVVEEKIGITDKKLLAIIYSYWDFIGLAPEKTPFLFYAVAVGFRESHIYYPVGGSLSIINETVKTIKKNGGDIRDNSKVAKILIKNKKACGVLLENGEILKADNIISAIGINETIKLIPLEKRNRQIKKIIKTTSKLEHIPSVLILRLGLEGDISNCGIKMATYRKFAGQPWKMDANPSKKDWEPDDYTINFPSYYDTKNLTGPTHTAEVVTLTKYEFFENYDPNSEEFKQAVDNITENLKTEFIKRFPKLKKHITKTRLSTPLDVNRSTGHINGSIYGLDVNKAKEMDMQPHTGIENLYFSGEDIFIAGIFPLNGFLTSLVILIEDQKKPVKVLEDIAILAKLLLKLLFDNEMHDFFKLYKEIKKEIDKL